MILIGVWCRFFPVLSCVPGAVCVPSHTGVLSGPGAYNNAAAAAQVITGQTQHTRARRRRCRKPSSRVFLRLPLKSTSPTHRVERAWGKVPRWFVGFRLGPHRHSPRNKEKDASFVYRRRAVSPLSRQSHVPSVPPKHERICHRISVGKRIVRGLF